MVKYRWVAGLGLAPNPRQTVLAVLEFPGCLLVRCRFFLQVILNQANEELFDRCLDVCQIDATIPPPAIRHRQGHNAKGEDGTLMSIHIVRRRKHRLFGPLAEFSEFLKHQRVIIRVPVQPQFRGLFQVAAETQGAIDKGKNAHVRMSAVFHRIHQARLGLCHYFVQE